MNWFGSTKTLDVHVSGLRQKLGDDSADAALHPHGPRRRLPVRRRRTSERDLRRMSFRAPAARRLRLRARAGDRRARGAAGANLSRPRRRRGRAREAPDQAQLVAASASGQLERGGARCSSWSTLAGDARRSGDRGRRPRARARRLRRARARRRRYAGTGPRSARGAHRPDRAGPRNSSIASTQDLLFTAVPVVHRGPARPARCG